MMRCLAGASSSATMTQRRSGADSGMGVLSGPSQRQRYFNLGSTTGPPVHGKAGFSCGIKPCYALTRDGKSEAGGVLNGPIRRKTHAVVDHTDIKPIASPVR